MDIYVYVYVTESQKKTKIYETGCLKCAITRKEKKKVRQIKLNKNKSTSEKNEFSIKL